MYVIADNVQIKTANSDTCLNNASNAMRVDIDDIKCKLTSGIFWTLYTVMQSPTDGHCFLHSIIDGQHWYIYALQKGLYEYIIHKKYNVKCLND